MGISGLLPCLRSVSRDAHVREYAGQRVAVDAYVWLHRGAFTCARELALGQPTDKCVRLRPAARLCATHLTSNHA
jgi:exonuclease-1